MPRAGAIRISDVFLGEATAAGFVPRPTSAVSASRLPIRVELCGDTVQAFGSASLTVELSRVGQPPLATSAVSISPHADPLRRTAVATLAIGALPAGDYLVTARLHAGGAEAATSRAFVKR